jgi:hypothetical protein
LDEAGLDGAGLDGAALAFTGEGLPLAGLDTLAVGAGFLAAGFGAAFLGFAFGVALAVVFFAISGPALLAFAVSLKDLRIALIQPRFQKARTLPDNPGQCHLQSGE